MRKNLSRRQFLKAGGAGGLSLALAPLLAEPLRATPANPKLPERVLAAAATQAPFGALPTTMPLGQPLADLAMGWDGSLWGLDADGVPHHYDMVAQSWQVYAPGIDAIALDLTNQFILVSGDEVYLAGTGGLPQPLASAWSGLPDSFAAGLDGAATVDTTLYLFRHGRYLPIDLTSGQVVGAPVALSGLTNWPSAPEWQAGALDAVGSHPTDHKQPVITLWTNGEYLTVDIAAARVVCGPEPSSALAGAQMLPIMQQGFSAVQYAPADPDTGTDSELRVFQGPVLWRQFDITGAALPSYLAEVESPWAPTLAHAPSGRTGSLWAATNSLFPLLHDGSSWRSVLPDDESINYATAAVAAGADGAVFALANQVLYRLADDASAWTRVATAPDNAVQLAVSDAADVWVRTAQNTVAQLSGTSFSPVDLGHAATHIAATSDGTLWHAAGTTTAYRFIPQGAAPSTAVAVGSGVTAVSHVAATGFGTAFVLAQPTAQPTAQASAQPTGPQLYRYTSPYVFKTSVPYTPELDFDSGSDFQAATQTLVVGGHAVFVVSTARVGDPDQSSRVIALDVQVGAEVWPAPFKLAGADGPANLAYDAPRNLLYVAAGHLLVALDARAGTEVWTLDLATPVPGATSCGLVTLAGGRLCVTVAVGLTSAWAVLLDPGDALARARQGRPVVALWAKQLPTTTLLSTGVPLIDGSGRVYVPYLFSTTPNETAAVIAFDAAGQVVWNRELDPISFTVLSPVLDAVLVPPTAGTPIPTLLVNMGSAVTALNLANGGVMRTFDLPNAANAMVSSGLRLLGDRVYLGDTQGTLYVLDTATLAVVAQTKDAHQDAWPGVLGRPALIRSDDAGDGLVVAFTRGDANVWLFDPATGTLAQIATDRSSVAALAYDDTHGLLYACSWDSLAVSSSLGQFFALRPDRTIQDQRAFIIESQLMQDYRTDEEAQTATTGGGGGVARYQTHVTIVDANNVGRASQVIKLWAEEDGTAVYLDGATTTTTIGPATPALFTTDATGSFTVVSDAGDLQSVGLQLWAAFMDVHERIVIVPDAEFHARLATTTATGSDDPQQVDTVSATSYDGNALFTTSERSNAQDAATMVTQLTASVGIGTSPAPPPSSDALGAPQHLGGTLQATDQASLPKYTVDAQLPGMRYAANSAPNVQSVSVAQPVSFRLDPNGYTPLTPAEAADSIDAMQGDAPSVALVGDAPSVTLLHVNLKKGIKDGWKEIKKTGAKVTHVVVSAATDLYVGVQYVVNGATKVVKAVVKDVKDALATIGSFFVQLGKDLLKVVEALSLLLHLGQIIKTYHVFKRLFASMTGRLKNDLDQGFPALRTWLGTLEGDAEGLFGALIAKLEGAPQTTAATAQATSWGQVTNGRTANQAMTVAPRDGSRAPTSVAVQGMWGMHTVRSNSSKVSAPSQLTASSNPIAEALASFIGDGSALKASLEPIQNQFCAGLQLKSASDIMDMAVAALLTLAEAAVVAGIDIMQDLVTALQALTHEIAGLFGGGGEIRIPIISTIWNKLGLPKLVALDLIAFVVAIPATFVYRAFSGRWLADDYAVRSSGRLSAAPAVADDVVGILGVMVGIAAGVFTAINDTITITSDGMLTALEEIWSPIIGYVLMAGLALGPVYGAATNIDSGGYWALVALTVLSNVVTLVAPEVGGVELAAELAPIWTAVSWLLAIGILVAQYEGDRDSGQPEKVIVAGALANIPGIVGIVKLIPADAIVPYAAPVADLGCLVASAGMTLEITIENWAHATNLAVHDVPQSWTVPGRQRPATGDTSHGGGCYASPPEPTVSPTPMPSPSTQPTPMPSPAPGRFSRFLPWVRR